MSPTDLPMMMPKSILVATDLNDLEFLLPEAAAQASATGAMVWLLHVIPPEAESRGNPIVLKEPTSRTAEDTLAKAALELAKRKIACSYEIRRWIIVDQVMEFIREHKIDRLILGTSGRGRMRKALIGSVAEALIRSVDIPVCTIGPHLKPWPITQDRPHNLIFATSIRHHPDLSFRFAGDLAARLHAELTILHVMKQAHPDLELEARARIKEMLEHAPRLSGQLRVRIRFGNIAGEILSECAALEPEFLVLGVLPASETTTSFREGVAYRLIANAPCPTFTLRDVLD